MAVNRAPHVLNAPLTAAFPNTGEIEWLSPRKDDAQFCAEYRDEAFLQRLGLALPRRSLQSFWPSRGPMWDGLARSSSGDVFLVEAKAHIPELVSPGSRAGEIAAARIADSLEETRRALAPKSNVSWSGTFYQYANRLAHLYLLRELNGIPAHLVNVYFVGDTEMRGPTSREEWLGAIKVVDTYLGVGKHRLSDYVHKIFIDVDQLR